MLPVGSADAILWEVLMMLDSKGSCCSEPTADASLSLGSSFCCSTGGDAPMQFCGTSAQQLR